MKIEYKKLIAREILWFVGFLIGISVFIAIMGGDLSRVADSRLEEIIWILVWLVILYLLRAVVWAIKITFFSKKN
jgi:ABC-type multidrug transport system fused ATPase/permease subunit